MNFVTYLKKRKHKALVICRLTTLIQKRFLKTTERTQIKINESAAIDQPDNSVDTTEAALKKCSWEKVF